jgi:prepilin-type N-terminal cleavage/methylation domain-containing protein
MFRILIWWYNSQYYYFVSIIRLADWQGDKLKTTLLGSRASKGMTLIELIVGMLIAVIVMAAAGTFLIMSTNLANKSVSTSDAQVAATSVAEAIIDQMVLADSVKIVLADVPPTNLPGNTKILFVGDSDAASITNSGYLGFWDDQTNAPYNYFGDAYYRNMTVSLEYKAVVTADKPKYFEITIAAQNRDGNDVKRSIKTFELVNASASASPQTSETANSLSQKFYLEFHFATNYGDYTQDALLVHLDAFDKYGNGFGRGPSSSQNKYIWKNLAPDTGLNGVGAVDFTLVGNSGSMPILDKRSIYFDGTQSANSNGTLNLTGLSTITVEIVFREADTSRTGFLFEYSTNWNSQTGGFGAVINHGSSQYSAGSVHTNLSCSNKVANYEWPNTTDVTTHTNVYSGIADVSGRQAYIDAVKMPLYTSGDPPGGWTVGSASPINDATEGTFSFGNQPFFVGTRNGNALPFTGDIYCVRVYGKKLTEEEIVHNYKTDLLRYQDREFG